MARCSKVRRRAISLLRIEPAKGCDARLCGWTRAASYASRWQKARNTVNQLETAISSRSDIDIAKGALIAIHGCDPPGAFAKLKDESQRRNTKLRDVAREMLIYMQAKS
jgi:AmiR/NasT family two-component response regulator